MWWEFSRTHGGRSASSPLVGDCEAWMNEGPSSHPTETSVRPVPATAGAGSTPLSPEPWLRLSPPQRRRRDRAADYPGERHDRQHVRYHLDELRCDHMVALKMYLHRLRSREQQARGTGAQRAPSPEDDGRNCDEPSARCHLIR